MGFFDSFSSGLSAIGSGIGSFVEQFAASPTGGAFLGQVGQLGVEKLAGLIGLKPSTAAGSPSGFGSPGTFGPFIRPPTSFGPTAIGPLGRPVSVPVTESTVQQAGQLLSRIAQSPPDLQRQQLQQFVAQAPQFAFLIPHFINRTGAPAPALRPAPQFSPSVPASQPFGPQPGDFSGGVSVAFPVTRQSSFPAPSFLPALFGGATAGAPFQTAGLAGSIARQLPGFIGGIAGGELLESFVGGGGGTPMFRPTMAGARAQFFRTQNPATGQDTWFRPAGRPLLWSGDLTACKRVNKVARRAARKR